jgi:hypothetical protein
VVRSAWLIVVKTWGADVGSATGGTVVAVGDGFVADGEHAANKKLMPASKLTSIYIFL